MPIMAAQGRNDARTAARLLASAAKDCLENPSMAPSQATVLNNVYRLLEAYRVNPFFGSESEVGHYSEADTLSLIPPPEQNVEIVRDVIKSAVEHTFQNQSTDEAFATVADVLRRVAYPEYGSPSDDEKRKATQFFSEVMQQLQLA